MNLHLTHRQAYDLVNALRTAAQQYDRDAEASAKAGMERTADQFTKQAAAARALADLVNDSV